MARMTFNNDLLLQWYQIDFSWSSSCSLKSTFNFMNLYYSSSFSLFLLRHHLLCLAASPMPASDISPSILRPSISSQKLKLTVNLYWGAAPMRHPICPQCGITNHLTQSLWSLNKSPSSVVSVISLAKASAIFGSTRWNNTLHLQTYKTR